MNPVYERALDFILTKGIEEKDYERTVNLIGRLLEKKHAVDHLDEISTYLQQKGASSRMAAEIRNIYQVLEAYVRGEHKFDEEYIDEKIIAGKP